jgi:uncharacterized protein YsxB (DUF464 family)
MILFTVKKKNDSITEINVGGHSNYDEAGRDIVCSAVSTAMFVSLGLIEKICPKYEFSNDDAKAKMNLKIIETNEFTELVLDNLVSSIKGVSEDYAKYLKVKFEK